MIAKFFESHCAEFKPGAIDCGLALADFAIWLGYPDPAVHLRGTYSSEEEFRAIVRDAGGMVSLVDDCATRIGWRKVQHPFDDVIAVIGSARDLTKQYGAIWDGERWLVRDRFSWTAYRAKPLAIWSR